MSLTALTIRCPPCPYRAAAVSKTVTDREAQHVNISTLAVIHGVRSMRISFVDSGIKASSLVLHRYSLPFFFVSFYPTRGIFLASPLKPLSTMGHQMSSNLGHGTYSST